MNTPMTNVCGYYNGNRWPIQLHISALNLVLNLAPGEYILTRDGRKVNDPFFEAYAQDRCLARETSRTPVPLVTIPMPTAPGSANPVQQHSAPVAATSQWKIDPATGKKLPQFSVQPPAPAVTSRPEIQAMSMEEARRRKLVRPVREVPEDFGTPDSTGLPPSNIPEIKYSVDPTVNRAAPPLPPEMTQVALQDGSSAVRSQLVTSMSTSAANPVSTNPFGNTTVPLHESAPATAPLPAVSEPELKGGTPATVSTGGPLLETLPQNVPLPEDTGDVLPVAASTVPVPPPPAPHVLPQPDIEIDEPPVDDDAPAAAAPPVSKPGKPLSRAAKQVDSWTCVLCDQKFSSRTQLAQHAMGEHRKHYRYIMQSA